MLLKGEGGDKNFTEAMIYFEKACEHNNTRALNGLGYLYFHGNAVGLYRFVFIISLYFLKQYI